MAIQLGLEVGVFLSGRRGQFFTKQFVRGPAEPPGFNGGEFLVPAFQSSLPAHDAAFQS
jgi:hypothetical protein